MAILELTELTPLHQNARRGHHARPTRWSRNGADYTVARGLLIVAGVRVDSLEIRGEPSGVDMGNWLMLGQDLPRDAHVVYLNHPGFGAYLFSREVCSMPQKYDVETRAKAVRLVLDHRDEYDSSVDCNQDGVVPVGDGC